MPSGVRYAPPLAAAVGLVLALAGVLAPPQGDLAGGAPTRVWVPLPGWLIVSAVAALSIASLILIAMILPRPRPRRKKGEEDYEMYREPQKLPPILAVSLLLLALLPGAILGGAIFWLGRTGSPVVPHSGGIVAGTQAEAPTFRAAEAPPSAPASPATTGLIGALALLVSCGGLGCVLWLRFGDRLPRLPADFSALRAPLAAAVDAGLDDLRAEPDPRTAIIRSYQNFERTLAKAAFPRRPWQTPVEFMRAVLGAFRLPQGAIRSLTEVFELARFSAHPVGSGEREIALRSLHALRGALQEERPTVDAPFS
jgi:hypothetical protein